MYFELSRKNIILLTIFILIIILGLTFYNYRNPAVVDKKESKIILVKDYSRFFTISNAGNKYISYLKNKDVDSLMLLLSDIYKTSNNITRDNILEKLTLLGTGEYTFDARKMYQSNLNNKIIRYYIYGYLTEEVMDEYRKPSDYYLIIDLDTENFTYAVLPYDGEIFKESK